MSRTVDESQLLQIVRIWLVQNGLDCIEASLLEYIVLVYEVLDAVEG